MDGWIDGWMEGGREGRREGEREGGEGWMDANPAGVDTKIMMNCGKIHLKRTKIDLLMNKLVVVVSC
jgi:hypothetical protein